MDTGKRQVVWVETSPGMFEPRDVQVGQRTDDKVQILSGLKRATRWRSSGGYLIDSEAQLKGGGGGMKACRGMKMEEQEGACQLGRHAGQKRTLLAVKDMKCDAMNMDD